VVGLRYAALCFLFFAALAGPAQAAVPATCPGPEDPALGPVASASGSFDASLENSYVHVPFSVPADTTGVRVRYCFDQPDILLPSGLNSNTLDLSVYEPLEQGNVVHGIDELRGGSGSAIRDVTIAVNGFSSEATYEAAPKTYVSGRTTRAFQPGPIPQGEWVVELGLASIATSAEGNFDNEVAWRVDVQTTSSASFADNPHETVPYDPTPVREGPGWYAGDFHVHGEHEPGNALMRETLDFAFRSPQEGGAGLDFVQLVDHNNTVAFGEIGKLQPDYPKHLISRGTELTTYRGHANALALGAAVDHRTPPIYRREPGGTLTQVRGPRAASEVLGDIRADGGFTQINHPTIFPSLVPLLAAFCRGCPWDYSPAETQYSKVDAIEVQTGPPGLDQPPRTGPNPFTPLAVSFWDRAIDDGGVNSNHIAATGSSDSHKGGDQGSGVDSLLASPVGEATTVVFAEELSEDAIQEGVEAAHTYVKPFGQTGPDLRLEAVEEGSAAPPAIIGDELESASGFSATFEARVGNLDQARSARPGDYFAVVFRDASPLFSLPIPPTGDEFSFEFPALGFARYRIQVQREGAIEALSSPIWVEPESGEPPPPVTCADAPTLELGDGDERFEGTPGPDRVKGRRGSDAIFGAAGDDCLNGGRGQDRVRGDAGEDLLKGGGGADRIRARDGEPDEVVCGVGRRDRVSVDRKLDTHSGCEAVKRLGP
jgi:Ca2+-binding RTX toxin-like protein